MKDFCIGTLFDNNSESKADSALELHSNN